MNRLDSLKAKALQNPEVKAAYDELAPEFAIINLLLHMRSEAGMTQQQIAEQMGTREANISRLENGKTNPTIKTITNYAKVCGFTLKFACEPLA